MFKTKLQELCHKNRWALPTYSTMKDGPDHIPSFKSSVFVNGVFFHSLGQCKSCKDAQNQAAECAYLHFTSPPPASPGSSMPTAEHGTMEQKSNDTSEDLQTQLDSSVIVDLHCQVKNQLQNYARSKNLDPPIFSSKSKGPSHATRFKASVTVGGRSFDSPAFFNTLKEAEQAAAKIALLSFSLDSFQRGDSRLYKSLLHELAQREGFCIPTYKTTRAGASHMPIFLSTVEVDGRIFHGELAKSKKQAELNAAVVAYTVLKECGLNQNRQVTSPNDPQHEAVEPIHGGPVVAPLAMNEENKVPHKEEIIKNRNLSPSELAPVSSKLSPFSELSHPDLSSLSISRSTLENNLVTTSYLLCGRFRVYTCFPDDAFPEGTTVVPVSENRWMAVSLRFPNENCY